MIQKRSFMNFQVLLAFFLMLGVLAACGSDDVENIVEEILPDTKVRAIHLSPDAPEVDIDYELVEVQETIVGLAYKEASPYTEVSTGTVKVTFKRASDGEELGGIEDPVFASDIDNTVYAVNFAANLEFIQSEDDRTGDADNATVRFVHAAPDAPQVDVKTDAADGSAVFSGAAFKDITDYTTVPPGDYVFVVTAAGDTENAVVTFESVTLDAGGQYTIVALGTLDADDDYDFGVRVFIDSGNGDSFVDLTIAE